MVISSYYNPELSPRYFSSLMSFPYTGGLVLHNFILGINNTTKEYIFNTKSLQKDDVTKLDGPLLNSKLYQRFINSGKNPIVLKTATFTQGWIGQYAKYNFGKYGSQDAYYNYNYGFSDLGTKKVPKDKGSNSIAPLLGNIELEYYYYDGTNWILEKEIFYHDDDESNYTSYQYLGNKYYDSKWNFPIILYNYDVSYVNLIGKELFWKSISKAVNSVVKTVVNTVTNTVNNATNIDKVQNAISSYVSDEVKSAISTFTNPTDVCNLSETILGEGVKYAKIAARCPGYSWQDMTSTNPCTNPLAPEYLKLLD